MKFEYQKNESIPSLSWLAEINESGGVIRVVCGAKVECSERFFVSGVWDGPFEKGEFDTALSFLLPLHPGIKLGYLVNGC